MPSTLVSRKLTRADVLHYLRGECEHYRTGFCRLRRCLIAGGIEEAGEQPVKPMCEYRMAAELIETKERP